MGRVLHGNLLNALSKLQCGKIRKKYNPSLINLSRLLNAEKLKNISEYHDEGLLHYKVTEIEEPRQGNFIQGHKTNELMQTGWSLSMLDHHAFPYHVSSHRCSRCLIHTSNKSFSSCSSFWLVGLWVPPRGKLSSSITHTANNTEM